MANNGCVWPIIGCGGIFKYNAALTRQSSFVVSIILSSILLLKSII